MVDHVDFSGANVTLSIRRTERSYWPRECTGSAVVCGWVLYPRSARTSMARCMGCWHTRLSCVPLGPRASKQVGLCPSNIVLMQGLCVIERQCVVADARAVCRKEVVEFRTHLIVVMKCTVHGTLHWMYTVANFSRQLRPRTSLLPAGMSDMQWLVRKWRSATPHTVASWSIFCASWPPPSVRHCVIRPILFAA